MKRRFRRGCRGAISVFLVIIFVAQYALCGLLVDGARHKMAQAMAESALDSASYSILSYYNKLLFDLYGLMGTDSLSEDNINTLMNDYVGKTLGAIDVDLSAFDNILSLFDADISGSSFDGYDFQFGPSNADTPQITAELTANLADTDFVQYQLIEHMKYRAPVSLLTADTGLLAKLADLVKVKDKIKAITERLKITDENKGAMEDAKEASQLVDPPASGTDNSLRTAAQKYVNKHTAEELTELCTAFNAAVDAVIEENKSAMEPEEPEETSTPEEGEGGEEASPSESEPPPDPWTKTEWENALTEKLKDVLNTYQAIRDDAADLSSSASNAYSKLDEAIKGYKAYIEKMEKRKSDPNDPISTDAASVFDTEIQSAKASTGALMKSIPFVEMVKTAADRITQADEDLLTDAIHDIAQELYDNDDRSYTHLSVASSVETDPFYVIDVGEAGLIAALSSTKAEDAKSPGENQDGVKLSKAKDEVEEEPVETAGLTDLKEDDMEGAYSDPPAADDTVNALEMEGIDDGAGTEVLSGVTGIFDKLLAMLESQRDSLYIAQYIITYFPNYVNNYKATGSAPPSTAKFNASPYEDYCATKAEVEYILTGNTDTGVSVTTVKAMLLGVRTAFNLAAIFTDPAKVNQANTIAAAISGPFAPAIAIAILVGWAIAESTIDVSKLCNGEEIAVFKSKGDWTLSIEGLVDYVASSVIDLATKSITTLGQKAQSVANEAIYAAHEEGNNFVGKAKDGLTGWTETLTDNLEGDPLGTALADELKDTIDTTFSKPAEDAFDEMVGDKASKLFQDLEDKALLQVSKVGSQVEEKLKTASTDAVDKLAKAANGKISEALGDAAGDAVADAAGGGTPSFPTIKMGYMDYIQIFLLMTSADTRTQRIQQLIQANMRAGGQSEFKMAESFGALKAELTGSIKFLFMSEAIIPAGLRQSGRLDFTVHSSVSY